MSIDDELAISVNEFQYLLTRFETLEVGTESFSSMVGRAWKITVEAVVKIIKAIIKFIQWVLRGFRNERAVNEKHHANIEAIDKRLAISIKNANVTAAAIDEYLDSGSAVSGSLTLVSSNKEKIKSTKGTMAIVRTGTGTMAVKDGDMTIDIKLLARYQHYFFNQVKSKNLTLGDFQDTMDKVVKLSVHLKDLYNHTDTRMHQLVDWMHDDRGMVADVMVKWRGLYNGNDDRALINAIVTSIRKEESAALIEELKFCGIDNVNLGNIVSVDRIAVIRRTEPTDRDLTLTVDRTFDIGVTRKYSKTVLQNFHLMEAVLCPERLNVISQLMSDSIGDKSLEEYPCIQSMQRWFMENLNRSDEAAKQLALDITRAVLGEHMKHDGAIAITNRLVTVVNEFNTMMKLLIPMDNTTSLVSMIDDAIIGKRRVILQVAK